MNTKKKFSDYIPSFPSFSTRTHSEHVPDYIGSAEFVDFLRSEVDSGRKIFTIDPDGENPKELVFEFGKE